MTRHLAPLALVLAIAAPAFLSAAPAFLIAAPALLLAAPALARDEKAAAACAAKLAPDGRAMYESVAPDVKPDTDLRELIRSKAIPMVMFGSLTREAAQANGPAAGACAVLLK